MLPINIFTKQINEHLKNICSLKNKNIHLKNKNVNIEDHFSLNIYIYFGERFNYF